MNRRAFWVIAALLVTALSTTVSAQSIVYPIKVTIPFDFYLGDLLMHQGDYSVFTLDPDGTVIMRGEHDSAMLRTLPDHKRVGPSTDELVFDHVNGEYYLASVWTVDDGISYQALKSRREKEQAAEGAQTELKVLLARAAH